MAHFNDERVKPWKCENGHVMGYVRRNGSGIRQLFLLREAIDPENVLANDPDTAGIIEGFMPSWVCSICGSMRTWVPGKEAMDRLISQAMERRGE